MMRWIGSVNDRRGHEFNERVAEEFRKLNFRARASVRMTAFNTPVELGDLGDIDVLAWTTGGTVYAVECKNLRFARTIAEIVEQLNRFRGEVGDELNKHVRRCDWLRENIDVLSTVIDRSVAAVDLKPLMVTNTIVPMQF